MCYQNDFSKLAQEIIDRKIRKEELLDMVKQDSRMIPLLLRGISFPKASVRYSCSKVLLDLSKDDP